VFNKLKDTQAKLEGDLLGGVFWWSLSENSVSHANLVALARQNGVPEKYLPNEIKPHQAFKRAVKHAATMIEKGEMLRYIDDNDAEIVVGLVKEEQLKVQKDLAYALVEKITFEKLTGKFLHEGAQTKALESIKDLYQQHLDHMTDDIRKLITTFLGDSGVKLRESGGVYFVARSGLPILDAVCAVVDQTGKNKTYQLPIIDTPDGKGALQEVAQKGLEDEIRQLKDEIEKFDVKKVRQSSLDRKLKQFDDLRGRVRLFSDLLSFQADELNGKISYMQAVIRGEPLPEQPKDEEEPDAIPAPKAFDAQAGF
jgi:hypothetical protein